MNVSYDFSGEVAVITGAARGVGRTMVGAFTRGRLPGGCRRPGQVRAGGDMRALWRLGGGGGR